MHDTALAKGDAMHDTAISCKQVEDSAIMHNSAHGRTMQQQV